MRNVLSKHDKVLKHQSYRRQNYFLWQNICNGTSNSAEMLKTILNTSARVGAAEVGDEVEKCRRFDEMRFVEIDEA